MQFVNLLYLVVFIMYIVQGVMIATGNLELSTFSATVTSLLLSAWVGIAFMNKNDNKSE